MPPPPSPPPNLRQPCPALPLPADDRWESLIRNHDETTTLYHGCRASQAQLIEAVAEWERTAWGWYCAALERITGRLCTD